MTKHHEVTIEQLLEWLPDQKILFASSSKEDKQLYVTTSGSFQVYHRKELVFEGVQPYPAIEKYNSITEK